VSGHEVRCVKKRAQDLRTYELLRPIHDPRPELQPSEAGVTRMSLLLSTKLRRWFYPVPSWACLLSDPVTTVLNLPCDMVPTRIPRMQVVSATCERSELRI
jgi:hypothetical protein